MDNLKKLKKTNQIDEYLEKCIDFKNGNIEFADYEELIFVDIYNNYEKNEKAKEILEKIYEFKNSNDKIYKQLSDIKKPKGVSNIFFVGDLMYSVIDDEIILLEKD